MKQLFHKIITSLIVFLGLVPSLVFSTTALATPAYAASCGGVDTSIISCSDNETKGGGIFAILNIILTVLSYGVGIAGTLGIVISGIQYLTARDNEQQMAKAKNRIINTIIGIAAYAVLWGFLQWLIPGGVLNGS